MFHCAALWIGRAIREASDPCMGDRPSTHGAGFQRDPQIATGQAEIAKGCRRLTNGDDFRMGGGVLIAAIAIFPFTDNDAVLGYDCTELGSASCRESVCQYVENPGGAGS